MIPVSSYTETQRAFIQNTLDGVYDDGPGNAPAVRRSLRNALAGLYRATLEGNGHGFQRHLATLVAANYRSLDTLTAEDFAVFHLVTASTLSALSEIVHRISELHVYTASLQMTRTIQSPELRQRYQLDAGQQRPLPL